MLDELLRVAPRATPEVTFEYESYEPYATPTEFRARLDVAHAHAICVIAPNAHIEVSWDFARELFAWCLARSIPAYTYAYDYWPHHRDNLVTLTTHFRAGVLACSQFLVDSLHLAGFNSQLGGVGVPLPDHWPDTRQPAAPKTVASAGRLVPRKRLADVARGYAESGVDGFARLYLRLLPSGVFGSASDLEQLREIETEIDRAKLVNVTIDRQPAERPDYASYAAYVCSSSYEGFSMPPVEAAFAGCPPLMSDIPPHQRNARTMFGSHADDFLYPVGDYFALAALLRDELATGRRKLFLDAHLAEIRTLIAANWSIDAWARTLSQIARDSAARRFSKPEPDVDQPVVG